MRRTLWTLALAGALVACTPGSVSIEDAGVTADGGGREDAGAPLPDAGSDDAGVKDSGTDVVCPYAYCDDFEHYDAGVVASKASLGPWKTSVSATGAVLSVDGLNAKHGAQALHIMIAAGDSASGTLNQTVPTGLVTGNDMFGRAEVFYSDAGTNGLPLGVHSWLFQSKGKQSDGGSSSMNLGGGGTKLQLNYHPPAPLTEEAVQGGGITAGTWHCLQWQYNGAGNPPADIAKVWIDGALAVDVPVTKGWTFPTPWTSFDFGFTHYQTLNNPVDVYLDDFALDGAMVPCR